jgi:ABC-type branched-subunit amino acid transport system permease subunit
MGFVTVIERARLGRLLRGMSDSQTALSTLGTNTNVTRVLVFCASAFMAGVSGALVAGLFPSISSAPFPYLQSLIVLAVLMISGRRTIPAAIIATFLLTVPAGYLHGSRVADIEQAVFGLAAVLAGVASQGKLTEFFAGYAARHEGRLKGPAGARVKPSLQAAAPAEAVV